MSFIRQYDYNKEEAINPAASMKGKEVALIACHIFLPEIDVGGGGVDVYVHKGTGQLSGIFSFLLRSPTGYIIDSLKKESVMLTIQSDNKTIYMQVSADVSIPLDSTAELLLTVKA